MITNKFLLPTLVGGENLTDDIVNNIFTKAEEYKNLAESLSDLEREITRDVEPIEDHISTITDQEHVYYYPLTNQVEFLKYNRDFNPTTSMMNEIKDYLKAEDSYFKIEEDKLNHGSKLVIYLKYD